MCTGSKTKTEIVKEDDWNETEIILQVRNNNCNYCKAWTKTKINCHRHVHLIKTFIISYLYLIGSALIVQYDLGLNFPIYSLAFTADVMDARVISCRAHVYKVTR